MISYCDKPTGLCEQVAMPFAYYTNYIRLHEITTFGYIILFAVCVPMLYSPFGRLEPRSVL